MLEFWGGKKWSLFRMRKSKNNFEPIPHEHEDDNYTQKECNLASNDTIYEPPIQHHTLIQNTLNVGNKSPLRTSSFSKAHLLSTKQLMALTFFTLSGGPFKLEAGMATGGPMLMLIFFMFSSFFWPFPLTFMTTEMTCMIPQSGGHVLWVYRAFGPFWSYTNGCFAFVCSMLDNALYPSLFLEYLSALLASNDYQPLDYIWSVFIKMLIVIIVTIINILGIDVVGNVSIFSEFMVLTPFIIFCIVGLKYLNFNWAGVPISKEVDRAKFLSIMLMTTSGIDVVGTCASEVLTPSHSYPLALKFNWAVLVSSYSLPLFIAASIVPNREDWNVKTIFYVANVVGGKFIEGLIGIAALFSAFALLSSRLCTNSRILYGMAQVQQMPSAFTWIHPKFATPWVAILTSSLFTLVFNFFSFYHLDEANMLFYALSTLLKFGALIQLRYTEPDVLRPFQIPIEKELLTLCVCIPMSMCIFVLIYASERNHLIVLVGSTFAILSYICKELLAQYGIKEAAHKRIANIEENLRKMQKRIDVVVEIETKELKSIGPYMEMEK